MIGTTVPEIREVPGKKRVLEQEKYNSVWAPINLKKKD